MHLRLPAANTNASSFPDASLVIVGADVNGTKKVNSEVRKGYSVTSILGVSYLLRILKSRAAVYLLYYPLMCLGTV